MVTAEELPQKISSRVDVFHNFYVVLALTIVRATSVLEEHVSYEI